MDSSPELSRFVKPIFSLPLTQEFQFAKMEKAEILELAVKHLKEIRQRRQINNGWYGDVSWNFTGMSFQRTTEN